MNLIRSKIDKRKSLATKQKYYTPAILVNSENRLFWRRLNLTFFKATPAIEYAERVVERFNRIWKSEAS